MSAKQRIGMDGLVDEILKRVYSGHRECRLLLPYERGDLFSYLKEHANVIDSSYEADGIHVTAECGEADLGRLAQFVKKD